MEQQSVQNKMSENRCVNFDMLSNYELVGCFQDIHPFTDWLIEHAADMSSKFLVGDDGQTAYERAKEKRYDKLAVEFGELVHYLFDRRKTHENWLDSQEGEGIFLGMRWRTGEFIIGTLSGQFGAHRRWDGEAPQAIRGWP